MIAILRSNKKVLVDAFNNVNEAPVVAIHSFTEDKNGFTVNGQYTVTIDGTEKVLHKFIKTFTVDEVDQLFPQLNIEYPQGATFNTRRKIEIAAALKFIVVSESRFGLTTNDWE